MRMVSEVGGHKKGQNADFRSDTSFIATVKSKIRLHNPKPLKLLQLVFLSNLGASKDNFGLQESDSQTIETTIPESFPLEVQKRDLSIV